MKGILKLSGLLVCIGFMLGTAGCTDKIDSDQAAEKAAPQQVEHAKKEDKPKEDPTNAEKKDDPAQAKDESASQNKAADSSSTGHQAAKPAPVKKTETSGTTEHVPVKLVKAIDGDTIKVLYNGKEINVRYLLIDTPETNHPRLGKQPFGEEAKERNRQLVNSGALTLEFDIGERYDKYDRLLAYIYVDGKSVQKTLLAEGLARVAYVYPPNTRHLDPFEEAQAAAKEKGLGIWSVENYATDSGFDSDAVPSNATGASTPNTKAPTKPSTSSAKPTTTPSTKAAGGTEWFKNCTELRKKYPNGVPEGHVAYQAKMDRDKDGFACEK